MLPFPFVAEGPFAERIEAYPDFIQNLFFIYYVVFGIFGGLCSILVYPIAYVIPAIVYLSRYFQAKPQKKQRLGFVLFVLLFFPGIIVMLFRTPFNIV